MTTWPILPRHRIIVAVDIEGSTNRTNIARARLRNDMYDAFEDALRVTGVPDYLRDPFVDRGDGALALLHFSDQVPITRLLDTFTPRLNDLLSWHARAHPDRAFRLRAALHTGTVHFDGRGVYGEDVDIAVRLLDDAELKSRLQRADGPLVLVVSDLVYRSVVRHGYERIDARTFEQLVRVEVARQDYLGWVQVPAEAQPVAGTLSRIDRVS
ncbi:nucleotidyl cyclase domain-containing protein [Actinophytocola xanthii]|uniref:Guanylate cyclase domain-containing protein n=1 Tax=Actinophytocola xanthii TaxID=1912961 RepID=A0A1Q8CPN2_9PSEU|nr:hypothetical protein [Actinophytocola xanthii]OLF16288.1 hypothetical protein BU204_16990 [Actinophytocola xanthii]